MDKTDEKIIEILQENGQEANTAIAKKVNLSEAAVRKRIANMLANGTIRKFTVEMGSKAAIGAVCLVSVDSHFPSEKVAARIEKMSGVRHLHELTGNYDIVAFIEGPSAEFINGVVDEIRNLPHVESTDTRMVLRKWK
jgi:DNA-binding Lrp family transcriptional regulator